MYNCVWYFVYNCVLIFCIYLFALSLNWWHALFCITNSHHGVTIPTHAVKRHYLIWMTMVRQPTKHRCSCILVLKYTFICIYWWTRQRIHNTSIVVDRYLRLMGYKMIPDSAEPRLESFHPPWVAGIDLPHQGAVDYYNLDNGISYMDNMTYWYRNYMHVNTITFQLQNFLHQYICRHFYVGLVAHLNRVHNVNIVIIVGDTIPVPCHVIKSLQLI